ncbi:MAG: GNAT family N-acetyltransferase, partial [Actinomadura sp.]
MAEQTRHRIQAAIRPEVEHLTVDDLPDCLALAADRAWPAEAHKWRLLLEVGTAYGLRDEAGELVGTTILTRYQADLAAISMVLVAARHGRRGLGGRLMTHALAAAGEATVFLNATEYGRPLYERLGFVPVGMTHVHAGDFTPQNGNGPAGSRPAEVADLPAIRTLDAQVNGT